jgi:hypothetical protein
MEDCIQSMPSTGGFEHLHIITKAIHELYRRFGPQHLKSYRNTFELGTSADDFRRRAPNRNAAFGQAHSGALPSARHYGHRYIQQFPQAAWSC